MLVRFQPRKQKALKECKPLPGCMTIYSTLFIITGREKKKTSKKENQTNNKSNDKDST